MHNKRPIHAHILCKCAFDPRNFDNRAFWLDLEKFQNGLYLSTVEKQLQTTQCINTYFKTVSSTESYAICYPNLEDWILSLRKLAIPNLKEIILRHAKNPKEIESYFHQASITQPLWLKDTNRLSGSKIFPIWGYTQYEKPLIDRSLLKEAEGKSQNKINVKFYLSLFLMTSGIALITTAYLFAQLLTGNIFGMGMFATGVVKTMSGICFFRSSMESVSTIELNHVPALDYDF